MSQPRSRAIPFWLALAWTILVLIMIPVYWLHYGPRNFLWFSDIALIGLVLALWCESRLLMSVIAVGVLPLEMLWNIEFFARLIFGLPLLGMSDYMWDETIPLGVRVLSLFHIPLVIVIVFGMHRLRYDRRALLVQTIIAWIVLPLSSLVADDSNNINFTRGLGETPFYGLHPVAYVGVLMVALPVVVYGPAHAALRRVFKPVVKTLDTNTSRTQRKNLINSQKSRN